MRTEVPLEQALDELLDHRGRTPRKLGTDFVPHGVQVISAQNVTQNRLDLSATARFVDEDTADRWMPIALAPGDVLLSSEAPLGCVGRIGHETPRLCLGQRLFALRASPTVLDSKYLEAALRTEPVRGRLFARASGTTAQGIKQSELRQVQIPLPPLPEQRAIATVLGVLDGKIDSNRVTANQAEDLALLHFRRLFGGQVEGSAPLTEIAMVLPGKSYKSSDLAPSTTALISLKSISPGGGYQPGGLKPFTGAFKPEQVVAPGEIVVALTDLTQAANVVGRPAFVPIVKEFERLVASLDLAVLRPIRPASRAYLYGLLHSRAWEQQAFGYANGSTVLHLSKQCFPDFLIGRPSPAAVESLDVLSDPLHAVAACLRTEVETLTAIRDALLPKLVSGEIRVPLSDDPEEQVGASVEALDA